MRVKIERVQKNTKNENGIGTLFYIDYTRFIITEDGQTIMDTFKGNQIIGYVDKRHHQNKYFIDYANQKYQDNSGAWKKNYNRYSSIQNGEGLQNSDKGKYERDLVMEALSVEPECYEIFKDENTPQQILHPESNYDNKDGEARDIGFGEIKEDIKDTNIEDIDLENIIF